MGKQYWLMKSEPNTFSIEHLKSMPKQTEHWDGVRNYQARNYMRDDMAPGDEIFFYHSNCECPGIVGIATVASTAYPDHTAFDPNSQYFDPKSSADNPRWYMVDVKYKKKFKHTITLAELKLHPKLQDLPLVRKGNRLSIMPISKSHWDIILKISK